MKFKVLAVLAALCLNQAQAEDVYDMDADAMWDAHHGLTYVLGADSQRQTFESGFVDGQSLDGWVAIGNGNAVRFGFGDSMESVKWGAEIAQVGGAVTAFGPDDKPRGTYVSGDYFLSDGDPTQGSSYFFMEFAQSIEFVSFVSYNHGADSGLIDYEMQTLLGNDFATAANIAANNTGPHQFATTAVSGNFAAYLLGSKSDGKHFNLVAMKFNQDVSGIGFDNFAIRSVTAVPEPETYALMLLGMGALIAQRKKLKRA